MIELIATDLDGTLLRRDHTISPRTLATLRRLTGRGVRLALVTGRPLRWLAEVLTQLDCEVNAVCANGAVVYDPVADEVLRADPLAPDLLRQVSRRLREEVPGAGFAVEVADGRELRYDPVYGQRIQADRPVRALASADELYAEPAVKLLIRDCAAEPDRAGTDDFAHRVARCLAGLAESTHSSDSGLVEISAAGITKATGLAWLCQRYGTAAGDVVAFGDMPNDIPMLTWAGRAVAVENAHPTVLAVADEVTASNDEDGVAAYLDGVLAA